VGSLIEERRLVKLVQESIPSPVGFHLRIHSRATAKARLFADWLVEAT
ncbi:LysR family transcriptional regulator, partial [Sinorhizobium meliloti]